MIEQDTIKLLRECDAGVKMGTASIDGVLTHVHAEGLYRKLNDCRKEHNGLQAEIQKALGRFGDKGKAPNPIASAMSKMKCAVKLGLQDTDETVADLMTDGCNMGVKSLNKYLNRYEAADEASKDIAKRLINLEQDLTLSIRQYL